MKLKIEIQMDNAAFVGDLAVAEVRRLLEAIHIHIGARPFLVSGWERALRDSNGNRVGRAYVTDEE